MYDCQVIESLFGNECLQYLQRKNRGGVSCEKGNTFENFFAIYMVALLSSQVIEGSTQVTFYSQILSFVDDLVVDFPQSITRKHYQMKNSSSVSWGSGAKSIADDFRKQFNLNTYTSGDDGLNTELCLVVPDETLRTSLQASCPEDLGEYTSVELFHYASTLSQTLRLNPRFTNEIKSLSAFENPSPDKVECVAAVLLAAWVSSNKDGIPLQELLTKAQMYSPSFIRSFQEDIQLDKEVHEILANINHFSYNLSRGFLHWTYGNDLQEGTLRYSIDTDDFRRFQEMLVKRQPTCFEDIEELLL